MAHNKSIEESKNDNGEFEYFRGLTEVYPDFLSGTSTKIMNYDRQVYYKPIFNHFINNLKNSKILIVIDYGFGDAKINVYIENNFLLVSRKKMLVIDINKPNHIFFTKSNVVLFQMSISEINMHTIMSRINE